MEKSSKERSAAYEANKKRPQNAAPGSEKDPWDIVIQACSATDCTGLIPSLPQSEAELHHYEELYRFTAGTDPDNSRN